MPSRPPRRRTELAVAAESQTIVVLPWERQSTETEEAWAAFQRYRDMPRPRAIYRLREVRQEVLVSWHQAFHWKDRAAAYDRYLDKVRRDEIEEALRIDAREAAADHVVLLRDARELAMREFKKLLDASRESDIPGLIRPAELTKLLESVVKLDRLINNQSTDNVEHVVTDMTQLSTEELLQYEELQKKALGSK